MKAKHLKKLDRFTGVASLYEVDPPMKDREGEEHKFVIASATVAYGTGPEVYLFPADEEGSVVDWGEMDGSIRGSLSHEEAFKEVGYENV